MTKLIIGKYLNKFKNILILKKHLVFFLLLMSLGLLFYPILQKDSNTFMYLLLLFFYFLYVIQFILLLKQSYILFLLRSIFMVFFGFELFFANLKIEDYGALNHYLICEAKDDFYILDTIIGSRLKPNIQTSHKKICGNDTIFFQTVSIDSLGRRIALDTTAKSTITKNKHAVFLGCSFTFGIGLDDFSTFPCIFEELNPDYKSYNYGIAGYGPNNIALLFDEGINLINHNTILEAEGICIYTYINDHLNRVYGSNFYYSFYNMKSPNVYIEENNLKIKKRSLFNTFLFWVVNRSNTCNYFNISVQYPKSESFYSRFANIINFTAFKYLQLYPKGRFYVSLYPVEIHDTNWLKYLKPYVNIIYIPLPGNENEILDFLIPNDWHPARPFNEYYIKKINTILNN